jgi:membrane protein required for colicin V production
MNAADAAILGIVLLSVVIGIARGFIVEALSLGTWIAAAVAATVLGPQLADLFIGHIELPSARIALGYLIVFLLVLVAGALVTWAVRRLVEESGLSGTDRMLGLVFGLVRGVLIVVVLVLLAGLTPFPRDPWWRESQALPSFRRLAATALPWLPEAVAKHFDWSAAGPEDAPPRAPAPQPKRERERNDKAASRPDHNG